MDNLQYYPVTGPACYRPVTGHTGHTDIKYADESLKIATKQICENLSVLILKSKKNGNEIALSEM